MLTPLSSLQGMFTAPQKLIQKRYDKLLDYCSRLERSSSISSSSSTTSSSSSVVAEDPPGLAKRDYEALNALLVEELQRFNRAAYTILTNSVVFLVALLRELMNNALIGAPLVQQLPVRIFIYIYTYIPLKACSTFLTFKLNICCVCLFSLHCQTSLRSRTASWMS